MFCDLLCDTRVHNDMHTPTVMCSYRRIDMDLAVCDYKCIS